MLSKCPLFAEKRRIHELAGGLGFGQGLVGSRIKQWQTWWQAGKVPLLVKRWMPRLLIFWMTVVQASFASTRGSSLVRFIFLQFCLLLLFFVLVGVNQCNTDMID